MKMHSDLGKMYRRNYMVKSHLNSLEAKSRSLNEKINDETKIDEWAESYITRADAQIDDVSDYMEFRKLGALGHMPKDSLNHLAPDAEGNLDGITDMVSDVTLGNTVGTVGLLAIMGGVLGVITYDEYRSGGRIAAALVPRLRRAGIYAGVGGAAGLILQGFIGTGQKTGWY